MLKSYLKTLANKQTPSQSNTSDVQNEQEQIKDETFVKTSAQAADLTSDVQDEQGSCDGQSRQVKIDTINYSTTQLGVRDTSDEKLILDTLSNVSTNKLSHEEEEGDDEETQEEDPVDSGSEQFNEDVTNDQGADGSNSVLNRFDLLQVNDDSCDAVTDGHETYLLNEETHLHPNDDLKYQEIFEASLNKEEHSSRRKKNKRKQRRRQSASINGGEFMYSADVEDTEEALLSTANESKGNEQVECVSKLTFSCNPLNIRVERKYLNYSNELKLKSLTPSEATLFKRTLMAPNSNRSRTFQTFSLGNGSRFPSLSKVDASMEFDNDNPDPQHVLGKNCTDNTASHGNAKGHKKSSRALSNMQLFKLVHHQKYREIQLELLICLADVRRDASYNLVSILTAYPCHLETLVQLACLVEPSDATTASDLIERAVISAESIFHPRFLPSSSSCRMDYRRRENRVYFISLLKHSQFVSQVHKCHRAALEMAKSLYLLDPLNDPLASLLLLDHLALACGQYSWIVDTYNESIDDARVKDKLSHFPNWRYSAALAAFLSKQTAHADDLMDHALLNYPSVLRHLLDQCSVEPDQELVHCDYFDFQKPSNYLPKSLHVLVVLYAKRSACHWSADRRILTWLESRVRLFVQAYKEHKSDLWFSSGGFFSRNPLPAKNISRHILLSGLPSLVDGMIDSAGVTKYFDPFPPDDTVESYTISDDRINGTKPDQSDGILSVFLKSWLPDYSMPPSMASSSRTTVNSSSNNNRNGDALLDESSTTSSSSDLRSSVSSVLTAVKDLLSSVSGDDGASNSGVVESMSTANNSPQGAGENE